MRGYLFDIDRFHTDTIPDKTQPKNKCTNVFVTKSSNFP